MMVDRFAVSERRACRVAGQHRSTQRRPDPAAGRGDDELRDRLRAISREYPRWGYRTAWGHLRQQGVRVNRKRVQRLWREEGLKRPAKRRKRRRVGQSTGQVHRATGPGNIWAIDFQFDVTTDGRQIKLLHVIDEYTRQAHAIHLARSIDADQLVTILDQLAHQHGTPGNVRMDNGPEMTAATVRDWCRFNRSTTNYIEPGSPWQNPFVESFGSRVRDEVLAVQVFDTLAEAKVVLEDWRVEYNTVRPHSSLNWMTPEQFNLACRRGLTNKEQQHQLS